MGNIHYLYVDKDPESVESDACPSYEELEEFLQGGVECVAVWPNKRERSFLFFNTAAVIEERPYNLWATLLYHEITKHQLGLKGTVEEPYVDSIEALACCTPLKGVDAIYGNAIWVEGIYVGCHYSTRRRVAGSNG